MGIEKDFRKERAAAGHLVVQGEFAFLVDPEQSTKGGLKCGQPNVQDEVARLEGGRGEPR